MWMMRLSAMESMVDWPAWSAARAAAASPAEIAFWTFLIALRRLVRRLTLAARCLVDFLARFAACLVFAMWLNSLGKVVETKPDIIHHLSIRNKALAGGSARPGGRR